MSITGINLYKSVMATAQKYNYEENHSKKVEKTSLSLFEHLKPIHCLEDRERDLLSHACILHDIGVYVNERDHHKIGAYLIRKESLLDDYPKQQRRILSYIVKSHRRVVKNDFACEFNNSDRRIILLLGSILRIADSLDSDRVTECNIIKCSITQDTVSFIVECEDIEYIKNLIVKKSDLFEKVYYRKIEVIKK